MKRARTRSMVFVLVPVVLVLFGLVLGLAASFAESPSPAADGGKVILKVGSVGDPDSLNPFVGYDGMSYEVWMLNYDFVIGYNPADGGAAPALAESWSVSPDGKTWTLKIRQGATWQDGEPVTARDVAFSYNYIVEKDLAAYSSYTKGIKEAVAVDDYTCEVRCSKPKANMEKLYIYCFPEHIWGKIADPEKFKMTYPFIGSGPFQCVEWKRGNYIRLVKNPDYWGGAPTVDEIYFQIYQTTDALAQEFDAGIIDVAYDVLAGSYGQFTFTGLNLTAGTTIALYLAGASPESGHRGLGFQLNRYAVIDLYQDHLIVRSDVHGGDTGHERPACRRAQRQRRHERDLFRHRYRAHDRQRQIPLRLAGEATYQPKGPDHNQTTI